MFNEHMKMFIERAKDRSESRLRLAGSSLHDDDIKNILNYLKSIKYTPNYLDLDDNNIGDTGLKLLADFQGIEEINLDRNNITNIGLAALKTRQNLSLKKLNLSRNNLKSIHPAGGVLELIQAYQGEIAIEITVGNNVTLGELKKIEEMRQQTADLNDKRTQTWLIGLKNSIFRP